MTPYALDIRSSSSDFAARLQAARDGCKQSLGQILEDCRHYLLVVARANLDKCPNADSAADLVQDTLLLAINAFTNFRGDSEVLLLAWLRRILINHLRNLRTKKTIRPLAMELRKEPIDQETPSWLAMVGERADALEKALAELDADYRSVLILRYRDKLTWEEIGRRLGRSADAARMLHTRALAEIRQFLPPSERHS